MLDLKTKTHLTHCIFLHNHDSTTIQLSWLIWKDATILCTLRRILSSISFVMPESTIDENWNVFTTIDWRYDDVLFVSPFLFWFEEMVNRTRQVVTVHLLQNSNGLSPFSSNGYSYSAGQRARVCATTDRMCSIVIPWHSKYSSQLDRNCSNSVSVNNASICGLGSWSNVR